MNSSRKGRGQGAAKEGAGEKGRVEKRSGLEGGGQASGESDLQCTMRDRIVPRHHAASRPAALVLGRAQGVVEGATRTTLGMPEKERTSAIVKRIEPLMDKH